MRTETISDALCGEPAAGWPSEPCGFGRLLMHQQCWCWGQDIRSTEGNLLVSRGFERSRPMERTMGSTRYALRLPDATVWLWGFGIVYEDRPGGAIYLNRFSFRPTYSERPFGGENVWSPAEVMGFSAPRSFSALDAAAMLTESLLLWIASYEDDILLCPGVSYRRATLWNWHEPSILPESAPAEWRNLARIADRIVGVNDRHA